MELGAMIPDVPRYHRIEAILSSTAFHFHGEMSLCSLVFSKLEIDIRFPDLGTKEKSVREI